jgi:riboflavin biosynthesis pyrimidine reductase
VRPLQLLEEVSGQPAFDLPAELERLYGSRLGFPRRCLFTNFVETVDGVIAIPELERSNALIAGGSEADRFVMGLLRACADAVLIGTGTLLATPRGGWQADAIYPPAAEHFAELRRRLGKPERVPVAVVTTGTSFDPSHPLLERGALVLTTGDGADALAATLPSASEMVVAGGVGRVDLAAGLDLLRGRGHDLILSEAGPTLFSSLIAEGLVDQLFLTVSPLLAGRAGGRRLSLVDGAELLPDAEIRLSPLSIRRHEGHLFIRYAFV